MQILLFEFSPSLMPANPELGTRMEKQKGEEGGQQHLFPFIIKEGEKGAEAYEVKINELRKEKSFHKLDHLPLLFPKLDDFIPERYISTTKFKPYRAAGTEFRMLSNLCMSVIRLTFAF
jgi:hypothetical protein